MRRDKKPSNDAPTAGSEKSWKGRITPPVAVGIIALTVFFLTLAPTVTSEDSGELIAAAWHFGVPHPPGYPLWTILCGAFTHLVPIGSVAFRANLFSAVCSSAAAALLFCAIRDCGVRKTAAAAAALVWVWARWSWSQSVITEVYALNSLLTAGVLWCGLRWFRTRSITPLLVGCVLLGLGMCNHHTIALAALAVIVWIIAQDVRLLVRWRLIIISALAFLVALLPHLYLPMRARTEPPINWGNPSTLSSTWSHVSRQQYGAIGPTKSAEPRSVARLGPQMTYMVASICDDLTPYLTIAAALGMAVVALRRRQLLYLVLLWILSTGALFVVLSNYDLDQTSRWSMRVFFIPVSMGIAIPFAFALDRFMHKVTKLGTRTKTAAAIAIALLTAAGPSVQLLTHWRQCDYSNYWYAYDHAHNLLDGMLTNALVFPAGDHNAFPLVYVVMVEGYRDDVMIADIYGYTSPELCKNRPADSIEPPTTWLIKHARRPVYFSTKRPSPVSNASFVPAGLLYHLLPHGMAFNGSDLLEKCRYRNLEDPSLLDFGARHILTDYEFALGARAISNNDLASAIAHLEKAAEYGTGIKEVYNNIGSLLGENGHNTEAIAYFQQAADLDRHYVMPRWNLFRSYLAGGKHEQAREQLVELITAAPDDYKPHREMGYLLFNQLKDTQGAIAAWHQSLKLNPNQPEIHRALSILQAQSQPAEP